MRQPPRPGAQAMTKWQPWTTYIGREYLSLVTTGPGERDGPRASRDSPRLRPVSKSTRRGIIVFTQGDGDEHPADGAVGQSRRRAQQYQFLLGAVGQAGKNGGAD